MGGGELEPVPDTDTGPSLGGPFTNFCKAVKVGPILLFGRRAVFHICDFDVEVDGETGLMRVRSNGREDERHNRGRDRGLRIHDEGEWGVGKRQSAVGGGVLCRRKDIHHRRWGEGGPGGK